MTSAELDKMIDQIFLDIRKTLTKKGAEYSPYLDRLKNLKDTGTFLEVPPERALLGFVAKHIIALKDFIIELTLGFFRSEDQWDEKIDDIICYLILLKALLKERRENNG